MRYIWRLSILLVVGVVAFLVAINRLNRPPFATCQQEASPDSSYAVTFDERPSVLLTSYHLTVTHHNEPLGAHNVCLRADMGGSGGMSGMGLASPAIPVGPGKYEVPVRFIMSGPWEGVVLIQRAEGDNAEVPIHVDVVP